MSDELFDDKNIKKYKGLFATDIFENPKHEVSEKKEEKKYDDLTEKDKLNAALLILLFLVITVWMGFAIYTFRPEQGSVILEICKTTIPPLATLIIAFYWKDSKK